MPLKIAMKRLLCLALLPLALAACETRAPVASPIFPQQDWRHEDGQDAYYLLAPGDQLEIIIRTAPVIPGIGDQSVVTRRLWR